MLRNPSDAVTGGIFIAVGLAFGLNAWINLQIGTAFRMGPGYFPLLLCGLLVLLGGAIASQGFFQGRVGTGRWPWRALVTIPGALLIFSFTIFGLGLIPSVMILVMVASFASLKVTLAGAFASAVGLTAFCVAVFYYGFGLTLPLLGHWIWW